MVSADQGDKKDEIHDELEMGNTRPKPVDHIPIYIPTVENGLLDEAPREKRFLDFLKARPSRDWFLKFGFTGRLSPFSFIRRNPSQSDGSSRRVTPPSPGSRRRRRFRVPFVRKINWVALIRYGKQWIKNPMHMALLVWLIAVGICLVILLLVVSGLLNDPIPKNSQRKKWVEVDSQILNALFTILCLYEHPKLIHHLVMLIRWRSKDIADLRKVYCKKGIARPHERAHMMLVVVLLHITCLAQYALCGLYWGYDRTDRPDSAEVTCIAVGLTAPITAFVYIFFGPLSRKIDPPESPDEESQRQAAVADSTTADGEVDVLGVKVLDRRVVVTRPEWVGGLFDCWDDMTVAYLSFFCTFCVFGWNMERLGFGNMYVHIVTFMLLILAPFLVFNVARLNIDEGAIRDAVGITGIIICFFGLFYGGFWRIQMRKRFKLPSNRFCCGYPNVTDCMQWLFCWSCSLAQEVRTGNFYDVEEDSFYSKQTTSDESSRPVLLPLPREGGSGPLIKPGLDSLDSPVKSHSCPAKVGDYAIDSSDSAKVADCGDVLLVTVEEKPSKRLDEDSAMAPPVPPVMLIEGNQQRKS